MFLFLIIGFSIIENIENKLDLLNPDNILKRGYSITYLNGEVVKEISKIKKNDEVITKLLSGYIRSTIEEKSHKEFK